MEIRLEKDPEITEDDYIKVIEHKTASLFEASAKIGAILGDGDDDDIHAMSTFGNLLGIAYQIHDDLIDWNNEDRLFNILLKKNNQSAEFLNRMQKLYLSYSIKAKNEMHRVINSRSKIQLEHLTDLASLQL